MADKAAINHSLNLNTIFGENVQRKILIKYNKYNIFMHVKQYRQEQRTYIISSTVNTKCNFRRAKSRFNKKKKKERWVFEFHFQLLRQEIKLYF